MVFMFNELFWYLIASFKSFVHWKCRENNLGFKKIFLDFYRQNYYYDYVDRSEVRNVGKKNWSPSRWATQTNKADCPSDGTGFTGIRYIL